MSDALTLVLHYYNNRIVVERHLERFMTFSPDLLRSLRLLLVDDCSIAEERVDFDELLSQLQPVSLDLSVYRITDDIPWNQTGARNLGCFQAVTDWLFCTDVDHILKEADAARLVRYVQTGLQPDSLYRVQRRNVSTLEPKDPHANTFLVHRGSFVEVGGYDEDFAGGAGHSDKYFFHLWSGAGKNVELLDDVNVYVDARAGTKILSRDPDRNRQLYKKKMSGEISENANRINFKWCLEYTHVRSEVTSQKATSDEGLTEPVGAGTPRAEIEGSPDPARTVSVSSGGSDKERIAQTSQASTELERPRLDRQTLDDSIIVPTRDDAALTPQPLMSVAEIDLFQAAITGKKCAVEFGTGGSTFLLAAAHIGRIVSVDSDARWVRSVSDHPAIAPCITSGRLAMLHVDIGRIRKWGYPLNDERQADWHLYWEEPWLHVDPSSVDLVVIDGRFRVACGLNALLAGNGNMTIIIHDFWTRTAYHDLLKYCNSAARADNLAVLFPKQSIKLDELRADLDRFALIPR